MDFLIRRNINLVLDEIQSVKQVCRNAIFPVLPEYVLFQSHRAEYSHGDMVDQSNGVRQPGGQVAELDAGDVLSQMGDHLVEIDAFSTEDHSPRGVIDPGSQNAAVKEVDEMISFVVDAFVQVQDWYSQ